MTCRSLISKRENKPGTKRRRVDTEWKHNRSNERVLRPRAIPSFNNPAASTKKLSLESETTVNLWRKHPCWEKSICTLSVKRVLMEAELSLKLQRLNKRGKSLFPFHWVLSLSLSVNTNFPRCLFVLMNYYDSVSGFSRYKAQSVFLEVNKCISILSEPERWN